MSRNQSSVATASLAVLLLLLIVGHSMPQATQLFRFVIRPLYFFGLDTGSEPAESGTVEPQIHVKQLEERIDALKKENDFLRRDLTITASLTRPKALVRVLYKDTDPTRRVLHVTAPTNVTVHVGDPVVAPGDILVGDVLSVSDTLIEVRLLNDPGFKIAARLNETEGVLLGRGKDILHMTLIPAKDVPAVGELVHTSDNETGFPRDLLIGTITKVTSDPGDPFATLDVLPAAALTHLETVAILIVNAS